ERRRAARGRPRPRRVEGLQALPPPGDDAQGRRGPATPGRLRALPGARRRVVRHPAGRGRRHPGAERLGQVDAAEAAGPDPRAERRHHRDGGADRGAARARRRVPPRVQRRREHLPQRRDLRPAARGPRAARGPDHPLRRAGAVRRQPGQDVLERHVRPARVLDRRERRARHPARRRGARGGRPELPGPLHGPHARVPRRRADDRARHARPRRHRGGLRPRALARPWTDRGRRHPRRGRTPVHRRGQRQRRGLGGAATGRRAARRGAPTAQPLGADRPRGPVVPRRRRSRAHTVPQRRVARRASPLHGQRQRPRTDLRDPGRAPRRHARDHRVESHGGPELRRDLEGHGLLRVADRGPPAHARLLQLHAAALRRDRPAPPGRARPLGDRACPRGRVRRARRHGGAAGRVAAGGGVDRGADGA
ncbi:MAG: Teichoic acid export ATP-binding protein TagH, partial [uncultured Thermoleophilia bacterium]